MEQAVREEMQRHGCKSIMSLNYNHARDAGNRRPKMKSAPRQVRFHKNTIGAESQNRTGTLFPAQDIEDSYAISIKSSIAKA